MIRKEIMIKKERVAVYPLTTDFERFLKYKNLIDESLQISDIVLPPGWNKSELKEDNGMKLHTDFDEALEESDTVLFAEMNANMVYYDKMNDMLRNKMLISYGRDKNIIILNRLNDMLNDEITELYKNKKQYYKNFCSGLNSPEKNKDFYISEIINEIETPVIFVMGLWENTDKFLIQLALRDFFLKQGYKISQIGSKFYSEIFGFHSFPRFMFDKIYESQKITFFNHYVKSLEKEENPDVIIIGIPGGIMPYNGNFTNKFGITAFEVSNAIKPSYTVFSLLFNDYKKEYFELMQANVRNKFGYDIDCFNLGSKLFEVTDSQENKTEIYSNMDQIKIKDIKFKLDQFDLPIYNILETADVEKMSEHIINSLAGNSLTHVV
jgi:peptide maturation system protein (TIGR04066 family)